MTLHQQRGCLEFLTNDPMLTNHQRCCQNPHNHTQYQNRQKQQNADWDTVPIHRGKSPAVAIIHRMAPLKRRLFVTC
jgi:hypothetical protein